MPKKTNALVDDIKEPPRFEMDFASPLFMLRTEGGSRKDCEEMFFKAFDKVRKEVKKKEYRNVMHG